MGIILYEFIFGNTPWGDGVEEPIEIYEKIVKEPLSFPSSRDPKAKDLIRRLLDRNPNSRLGSNFAILKSHPWFENFDWNALYYKEIPVPYIPK